MGMRIIIWFLFTMSWTTASGQSSIKRTIDSLKTVDQTTTSDTTRMWALLKLSHKLHRINADSAALYTEKGYQYAVEHGNAYFKGLFTFRKALEAEPYDINKAIRLYRSSIEQLRIIGKDSHESYAIVSNLYKEKNQLDSAIWFAERALTLVKPDNIEWRSYILVNLALVYDEMRLYDQALGIMREANRLDMSDQTRLSTLRSIGIFHYRLHNYDSARYYFQQVESNIELLDTSTMLTLYNFMASNYVKLGDLEEAHRYQAISDSLTTSVVPNERITLYLDHAYFLNQTGQYQKAIDYVNKSLAISAEIGRSDRIETAYEELEAAYSGLKDYEAAYRASKVLSTIRDSVFSSENSRLLQEFEVKYRTVENEKSLLKKEQLLTKKSRNLWVFLMLTIVFFGVSTILYLFLRKRRQLHKKLVRLDRAKNNFFTNISHELKTPLTLINGPLELLEGSRLNKTQREQLKLAQDNSDKLLQLTNEILELSKIESGELKLHTEAVHLEPMLRRIFYGFHSLAEINDFMMSFSSQLRKDLCIEVDKSKLERVLNNLISNAFKYSKPGGNISLRARTENKILILEVEDTGIGISPSDQKKIFDRYYQVEEGHVTSGGTGIGLAYAYEIALLFGGHLRVNSQVGQGSTFRFEFPCTEVDPQHVGIEESMLEEPQQETCATAPILAVNKQTVLIVEDNVEMLQYLSNLLSPHFNCLEATNGQKALEVLRTYGDKIDVITSDIMMPVMNGFDFLSAVRKDEQHKLLPMILLTARTLESDKLKGFKLGVDDYITKPFSADALIARLHNLIENKSRRKTFLLELEEEETPAVDSFEEDLMKRAQEFVENHLTDSNFKIGDLAKALNYSHRQISRIIKKNTGYSPNEFVREIRLQKARLLMETKQVTTVVDARYAVGMENASYFTKKFSERFGMPPSQFLEQV